jgi:hypothetical protein
VGIKLAILAVAAAFSLWIAFPSDGRLRRRGDTFARHHQAYVDSEFVPRFDRATISTLRFWAIFFMLLVSAMVLLGDLGGDRIPAELRFLPLLGVFLAVWAGLRLHGAGREFPVSPARPPIARLRRVTLRDYVPVRIQIGVWVAVSVCLGLAGATLAQAGHEDVDPAFVTMSVISAAVLFGACLFVQLSGRAMCNRPQAAVDPCHLYFQDAWRAEFLVSAYAFVVYPTFLYVTGVSVWLDLSPRLDDHLFLAVALFYATLLATGVGSRLHFRRRLWPTLAQGQVLLPGEPVPPKVGASA